MPLDLNEWINILSDAYSFDNLLLFSLKNKVHPREVEPRDVRNRGRVRVQLKNEDNTPVFPQFPTSM